MSDKDKGDTAKPNKWRRRTGLGVGIAIIVWLVLHNGPQVHEGVPVTTYAIGETKQGGGARTTSIWDSKWQDHFGGVDTPGKRQNQDNWPAGFKPRENPYYAALPYSDLGANGSPKPSAKKAPWYDKKHPPTSTHSSLKNHWIMVKFGVRTAYVQWEDAGPGGSDDVDYVFGDKQPKSKTAGIGLSPAAMLYVQAKNGDEVSWRFVDDDEVPAGPWKTIVTTRQVTR